MYIRHMFYMFFEEKIFQVVFFLEKYAYFVYMYIFVGFMSKKRDKNIIFRCVGHDYSFVTKLIIDRYNLLS